MDGFYVYTYLREDGSPYYVGKGKGNRVYQRDTNHYPPKDRSKIHIFPMTDESTALAYERYFIDLLGRKDNGTGILRNLTDGGENPPSAKGKKFSAEHRRRIGEANLRRPPHIYRNVSNSLKGRVISDRTKQAVAESNRTRGISPDTRIRLKEASKRRACSGEPRYSMKELNRGANHKRWHVNRGVVKPGCALCQA